MTATAENGTRTPRRVAGVPLDRLTTAILIITLLGVCDAGYLVFIHYAKLHPLCVGGHGGHSSCETVQSSTYAELAGIPVALLGLIGYILLLATFRIPGENGRLASFAIALTGFAFSMYLTYRELFSIHAICEWCVGSATFMTLLMILTGIRWLRADPLAAT